MTTSLKATHTIPSTRATLLREALLQYRLDDAAHVSELGEIIADHLHDGMMHALLRGISNVETKYGLPKVAVILEEAYKRVEEIECLSALSDGEED